MCFPAARRGGISHLTRVLITVQIGTVGPPAHPFFKEVPNGVLGFFNLVPRENGWSYRLDVLTTDKTKSPLLIFLILRCLEYFNLRKNMIEKRKFQICDKFVWAN